MSGRIRAGAAAWAESRVLKLQPRQMPIAFPTAADSTLAAGESSVISLASPSPSTLKHLLKGEWGAAEWRDDGGRQHQRELVLPEELGVVLDCDPCDPCDSCRR